MPKIPLTDDSLSRLYGQLYIGYVHNRNKEMDRIDNSTGWSIGILVLALSLMINADVAYYFIPLSIFFIIPFWFKEARRYIYYMFWSLKESELENDMSSFFTTKHIDIEKIEEVVGLNRPLTVLSEHKSLYVRFYRSYFWMVLIIYITTVLLALKQGAFSSNIFIAVFLAVSAIMLVIAYKGRDEFIMPRATIMRSGISRHHR